MEHVLLYLAEIMCVSSRGKNHTSLYERLGVTVVADSRQIRNGFRKISLEKHPNRLLSMGIEVTPEHLKEFEAIKYAYGKENRNPDNVRYKYISYICKYIL